MGNWDFAMNDEHAIGECVYQQLTTHLVVETQGWAFDLVQRVAKQLNRLRVGSEALEPVVLWIPEVTAFIVPGRYVYISRELLQRFLCEDAVALVLGHEIAHHDLGHVRLFNPTLSMLQHLPGGSHMALALRAAERLISSPEMELEADKYGLELCLAAGYNGYRCLELFDLLEAHLLDHGDLDGVFGPEESEEAPDIWLGGLGQWLGQTLTWTEERVRGYPALRTRKERLLTRL